MSYTGFYLDNKDDSIVFVINVDHLKGEVVYETIDGPKTMTEQQFFHSKVEGFIAGDIRFGDNDVPDMKRYQKVKKWGYTRSPGVLVPITA